MSKWMLAVGVLAVGAMGCGRGADRAERMEKMAQWRVDDAMSELDATPAQKDKAKALTNDVLVEARSMLKQSDASREALLTEWKSTKPDRTKVRAIIDTQLEALRTVAYKAADSAIELHATLTPEQREQVSKRLEQRHR